LINRRMTWTTADGSFDLSKASDRKRISHEAVDNEHESGRTSERVQRSVRANAAKGRPHGRFGFGYRRVYTVDGHGRKTLTAVVEHEQEAPILREIAARFLAGDRSTRSGGTSPTGVCLRRTARSSGTAATCAG
jgi:DNA invertase Pin-like site-specific DNA recombinase